MADKQKLRDMLDSLIDSNSDQAQVDFHGYLEDKMKEVLSPEEVAAAVTFWQVAECGEVEILVHTGGPDSDARKGA